MQSSDHVVLCPVVGVIATGSVFTSGVWGRLASDNRKSRENSYFSNSLNVNFSKIISLTLSHQTM